MRYFDLDNFPTKNSRLPIKKSKLKFLNKKMSNTECEFYALSGISFDQIIFYYNPIYSLNNFNLGVV